MKEFALINAKVVTPKGILAATVFVKSGKIVEIKKTKARNSKIREIDLQGLYLLPGLIDAHVHFRTPGMSQKEDWTTGSKAALAGGVTTVLDMPNTIPATTTRELLKKKRTLIQKDALVNYGFYLGATDDNLEEIKKAENVAGVKVYMGSSTGDLLVQDERVLARLMAESGKLLAIHAEKEDCIQEGLRQYKATDDLMIHSRIRGPECAIDAVATVLRLVRKYSQSKIHFCHVSTGEELQLISQFKNRKDTSGHALNITVEATPHHLFLNEMDYEQYGNLVKVNPPLRTKEDQVALWKGIEKGIVDIIATDHAPHLKEEKMLPYAQVPSGIPGVQTMLPLLLHAVNEGRLTLAKVVELTAFNPARIFGIEHKGQISEGFDADFTVVNLDLVERVCHHFLWTKSPWSPFHGWYLKGWPVMTFVGGELMYEWREKFGKKQAEEVSFIKN